MTKPISNSKPPFPIHIKEKYMSTTPNNSAPPPSLPTILSQQAQSEPIPEDIFRYQSTIALLEAQLQFVRDQETVSKQQLALERYQNQQFKDYVTSYLSIFKKPVGFERDIGRVVDQGVEKCTILEPQSFQQPSQSSQSTPPHTNYNKNAPSSIQSLSSTLEDGTQPWFIQYTPKNAYLAAISSSLRVLESSTSSQLTQHSTKSTSESGKQSSTTLKLSTSSIIDNNNNQPIQTVSTPTLTVDGDDNNIDWKKLYHEQSSKAFYFESLLVETQTAYSTLQEQIEQLTLQHITSQFKLFSHNKTMGILSNELQRLQELIVHYHTMIQSQHQLFLAKTYQDPSLINPLPTHHRYIGTGAELYTPALLDTLTFSHSNKDGGATGGNTNNNSSNNLTSSTTTTAKKRNTTTNSSHNQYQTPQQRGNSSNNGEMNEHYSDDEGNGHNNNFTNNDNSTNNNDIVGYSTTGPRGARIRGVPVEMRDFNIKRPRWDPSKPPPCFFFQFQTMKREGNMILNEEMVRKQICRRCWIPLAKSWQNHNSLHEAWDNNTSIHRCEGCQCGFGTANSLGTHKQCYIHAQGESLLVSMIKNINGDWITLSPALSLIDLVEASQRLVGNANSNNSNNSNNNNNHSNSNIANNNNKVKQFITEWFDILYEHFYAIYNDISIEPTPTGEFIFDTTHYQLSIQSSLLTPLITSTGSGTTTNPGSKFYTNFSPIGQSNNNTMVSLNNVTTITNDHLDIGPDQ